MMAEAVFERDTKNTVGQGGQWSNNHTNLLKVYVIKIFFLEISIAI